MGAECFRLEEDDENEDEARDDERDLFAPPPRDEVALADESTYHGTENGTHECVVCEQGMRKSAPWVPKVGDGTPYAG
ncbi:hypothetical protein ACEPPN_017529 [Leptodophora sp. 'Broadleaf-Isolate-01']